MSKQRLIDTRFWDDSYIIRKDPVEKLLFLYFLTNPLTNICGIYEISLRRIAFDTGIDIDMVENMLKRFEKDGKIKYENGWVAIRKFIKYQKDNPKVRAGISYELKTKPESLINFVEILDYEPKEKEFKGKKVHKGLRDKILKKYDYKCCFCGSKDNLEIDHITPVFQGGTNEESNLRVLCQSCNGKRNAGLRWDKTINGWTMDSLPKKMGSLSETSPIKEETDDPIKEKMGTPSEKMGTPSEKMGTPSDLKPFKNAGSKMGRLSHPNPNPNPNLNSNPNPKEREIVHDQILGKTKKLSDSEIDINKKNITKSKNLFLDIVKDKGND